MKLDYIFERKKTTEDDYPSAQKIFEEMFKSIFSNVTHNCFQIDLNTELYTINYKCSGLDNEIYYLTLSQDSIAPANAAKYLDYVDKILQNGDHRKDFHIILSYDGVSEYYCEKLAPRFGKFERLMREFIYITLTKTLGTKWFQTVFTKEQQDELKKKSNIHNTGELIEQVLYEMTFAQLYEFLFQEFSFVNPENAIYEKLLTLDLENTEKNKIIKIIQSCRKTTLWKEFFISNEFDLSAYLNDMRKYRNKVAHNKFITFDEYNLCTKNLRTINCQLSNAISHLNSEVYSQQIQDNLNTTISSAIYLLLQNYVRLFQPLKNIISILNEALNKQTPYKPITTPVKATVTPVTVTTTPVKVAVTPVTTTATPVKVEVAPVTTDTTPIKVNINTSPFKDKLVNINTNSSTAKGNNSVKKSNYPSTDNDPN